VTAPLTDRLLDIVAEMDHEALAEEVATIREAALELARLESQLEAVRLAKPAPFMGER
jgi:hypothetical protein